MIDFNIETVEKHLKNIPVDRKAKWGNMNVTQMIDHLLYSVKMGNEKIPSPYVPKEEKAQKFQAFLASDEPMPKGFNARFAARSIETPDVKDANKGIEELTDEIKLFLTRLEDTPNKKVMNPEFGNITLKQWERLHSKHFAHHFEQFGG